MFNVRTEIQKWVAQNTISKTLGQLTNQAINLLEEELIAIAE